MAIGQASPNVKIVTLTVVQYKIVYQKSGPLIEWFKKVENAKNWQKATTLSKLWLKILN